MTYVLDPVGIHSLLRYHVKSVLGASRTIIQFHVFPRLPTLCGEIKERQLHLNSSAPLSYRFKTIIFSIVIAFPNILILPSVLSQYMSPISPNQTLTKV